jgi:hypothetical protein
MNEAREAHRFAALLVLSAAAVIPVSGQSVMKRESV